ncbi:MULTISPECIES: helix-turn-helix transcriptional regulator [unclassified Rhizobium]|uniref:helix-turn-helix transcriptional regulator n=1 Tax=unclassified Rhizobium TaxID=2613769 RepID=UPI001ADC3FBD|nr:MULTISPECIES: hypothetical protein [unclassified Rhizobium]MBO9124820.1 hypothetical protein [Rhizobium sp. 16-488-2b]MBO9175404.1 hypothetical protein [Rhizobium sp. 16-488-2a]
MRAANDNRLPNGIAPRGLCRLAAAAYVGIGGTLFDQMVARGEMPVARKAGGRVLWDRYELDEAFDALPRDGVNVAQPAGNPWDALGAA